MKVDDDCRLSTVNFYKHLFGSMISSEVVTSISSLVPMISMLVPQVFHSKQITVVNSRQVLIAEINVFLTKNFLEMGARNFLERVNFKDIVHFQIARKGICK